MPGLRLAPTATLALLTSAALLPVASAQSALVGPQAQLGAGYEQVTVNHTDVSTSTPDVFPTSSADGSSGTLVGMLGYSWQLSPLFTLGVGAEYAPVANSTSTVSSVSANGVPGGMSYRVSNRYGFFIAPGYVIAPTKLAYLKLGYANQRIEGTSHAGDGTSGSQIGSDHVSGLLMGIGYRQVFTSRWYGFAEANYYDFSRASLSGAAAGLSVSAHPEANAWNALVGVGYTF